jgi:hypothetical protein
MSSVNRSASRLALDPEWTAGISEIAGGPCQTIEMPPLPLEIAGKPAGQIVGEPRAYRGSITLPD